MTFYKDSSYDNITGEWHSGEWGKSSESHDIMSFWHYPPYNGKGPDSSDVHVTEPNNAISIGKGHLFSGYIEHYHPTDDAINSRGSSEEFTPMYSVHGRSKNLEEAKAAAKKYENIHNASYPDADFGSVCFYPNSMKDKHGNDIGVSWVQDHYIPDNLFNNIDESKNHIENMHKFLFDRNNDTRGGQKPMFSSKKWYDK